MPSLSQSVSEEFADNFAAGSFRDRGRNPAQPAETTDISERITVVKDDNQSHAAGFEVLLNLCTSEICIFNRLALPCMCNGRPQTRDFFSRS